MTKHYVNVNEALRHCLNGHISRALFARTGDEDDDFHAVCCDDHSRVTASSDMARFWLDFLGCRVLLDAKVAAERFYESTVRFINERVSDPIQKNDLYEHLHSQLKSQHKQFSRRSNLSQRSRSSYGVNRPVTMYVTTPSGFIKSNIGAVHRRIVRRSMGSTDESPVR